MAKLVRTRILAVVALTAALTAGANTAQAAELPSVGTNFDASGPYSTTTTRATNHTLYHPRSVNDGVEHPVILWGNGTGASPSSYSGFLTHLASHGFIVVAANTPNAGSGREMLAGIDVVRNNATLAAGADLTSIGATGHSQGGGGAIAAGRDARVDTIFPLQGWNGNPSGLQASSALYFSGQNDFIVSPSSVRTDYNQTTGVPAGYAELRGASHFTPAGSAGGYRGAATAWARWRLADDANAGTLFAGPSPSLATNSAWSSFLSNAQLRALSPGGGGGGEEPPPPPAEPCQWWQWWCD